MQASEIYSYGAVVLIFFAMQAIPYLRKVFGRCRRTPSQADAGVDAKAWINQLMDLSKELEQAEEVKIAKQVNELIWALLSSEERPDVKSRSVAR